MKKWKILFLSAAIFFGIPLYSAFPTAETNTFTNTADIWSGTDVTLYTSGATKQMEIASQATATYTYIFSGSPNAYFTLTLKPYKVDTWESDDMMIIKINNTIVYQSGSFTDGASIPSLQGQLNANGEVTITVKANTDASTEKLRIDDVTIAGNANYTVSNHRPFSLAFGINEVGNIKMIGNSVLTTASGCQTGSNNAYSAVNADMDSNASTFNSTSSDLILPSVKTSSDILYAGLYWQGRFTSSANLSTNQAAARTVKLKLPGSGYQTLTSDSTKFNWSTISGKGDYQGVFDITQLLKSNVTSNADTMTGYNETIWVADVKTDTGATNLYGAWSIVVVYKDSAGSFKNSSVYDGYLGINNTTSAAEGTVELSGFLTPNTYPINSSFMIFGGEGDVYYGDKVTLSNGIGDQPLNPLNFGEVFNSKITDENGSDITTRSPDCSNTMGVDIHRYNVGKSSAADTTGIIETDQTSTTVKLSSFALSNADWAIYDPYISEAQSASYDTYFPGVFAFSTDLYQPYMCYQEEIYKADGTLLTGAGNQVNKDDILRVKVTLKNTGSDTAKGVQLLHTFDNAKFSYKTGTTNYDNFNSTYVHTQVSPATDTLDSDLFDYNATNYLAKIKLGKDATNTDGGDFVTFSIQPQAYAIYEYNATVKQFDQNFSNTYHAAYKSSIAGGLDYSTNPVQMDLCTGGRTSFWGFSTTPPVTDADIIDTFSNIANYNDGTDKVIQTKVVSKTNVTITGVYLDSSGQAAVYTPSDPDWQYSVIPYWSDGTCSSQENVLNMSGEQAVIDIPAGQASATTEIQVKNKAVKEARFKTIVVDPATLSVDGQSCIENSSTSGNFARVAQCANSEVQYRDAFGDNAWSRCGLGGGKPCESSNHGSANPSEETYNPLYSGELGCYICTFDLNPSCSSDNFAIRPNEFNSSLTTGQQFQAGVSSAVTFYANQFGGSGTTDYNESEIASPPSFVVDLNISDSTKTCAQPSLHFDPRVEFSNGLVSGPYKITNIGDFNVTMHEINGSEFALVDADDTNDALRLITPFTQQIKVIPHHFELDGNFTNRSNGFTYFSNFEEYNTSESRTISASLDFNITAQAVDNNTTSNYTELCYAKDGNVTMTLANALIINPVGSLTKMLWYDQNHDINGSIALAGTTYSMDMKATQFDSVDVNGTAQVKYLINFDRDQILVVDPITMTINQVVATDTDLVSGTKVLAANNSANYLYGRIIPRDIRVFGDNTPFTANAWYEVYNASTIGATALIASKNDALWYTNSSHNDVNDGDATVTQVQTNGAASAASPLFDVNTFTSGVETYSETIGWPLNGYKAHIDTVPWLWYGMNALNYLDPVTGDVQSACLTHPCFNINVVPAIGATGSAKTGAETKKASKKSTSEAGAGGWKSTSDYAPAIR